ncbi:MAG: hypothetical protein PHY08_05230 [Candidatus Cloacimonetes bacterium]|jgi:hypothetical protein|nr:hypothetical protein [Candidatus Cloacimonadota bacterium]MDD4155957.1 hypothetical protein [Candidatus Cloacimonadota bacterium]
MNNLCKVFVYILLILYSFILISTNLYADNEYEKFIRIRIYHEKDEKFNTYIKTNLAKSIVNFQMKLRTFPDIETIINIAPDEQTFSDWLNSNKIIFKNTQAFCNLNKNEIFIKNPKEIGNNKKMISILLHEYIHLFISYHWKDAPLWFHEGLAVYFTEGLSFNHVFNFMSNYAFHQSYLLKKYAYEYPNNQANIAPYYFQASFIVKKIYNESPVKLYKLFEYSDFNNTFNKSFYNAFSKSQEEYLTEFEKKIVSFFYFNLYFGFLSTLWILLPIILIIARIRKQYHNKKILEEWELETLKNEIEKTINENFPEKK